MGGRRLCSPPARSCLQLPLPRAHFWRGGGGEGAKPEGREETSPRTGSVFPSGEGSFLAVPPPSPRPRCLFLLERVRGRSPRGCQSGWRPLQLEWAPRSVPFRIVHRGGGVSPCPLRPQKARPPPPQPCLRARLPPGGKPPMISWNNPDFSRRKAWGGGSVWGAGRRKGGRSSPTKPQGNPGSPFRTPNPPPQRALAPPTRGVAFGRCGVASLPPATDLSSSHV